MEANDRRRLDYLWKHRHNHEGENLQEQITIIRSQVEQVDSTQGTISSGAYVHLLRAATQEVAVGGEVVEWDQNFLFAPLEFMVDPPVTDLTIPKTGYYDVSVRLGWDSATPGGRVRIIRVRNGLSTTIWPPQAAPGLWEASDSEHFDGTAQGIPFRAGDVVRVFVDHLQDEAVSLAYGSLVIDMVDRRPPDGAVVGPVDYAALVLSHGPIGYWRMDESFNGANAVDSSGNGFHMTKSAGTTGAESGVMKDGSGSPARRVFSIHFTESPEFWDVFNFLNRAPFSVEGWFQPSSLDGFMALVHRHGTGNDTGWGLQIASDDTVQFVRADGSSLDSVASSALTEDTDYYLAGTYDGSTLRLYVNGSEVDNATSTINLSAPPSGMKFGQHSQGVTGEFDGILDEIAIYDYALSPDQVAEHYEMGTRDA